MLASAVGQSRCYTQLVQLAATIRNPHAVRAVLLVNYRTLTPRQQNSEPAGCDRKNPGLC